MLDHDGKRRFEAAQRQRCVASPIMDPWTLAYPAGHRDVNITKRHVGPQEQTIRAAMDRARGVEGILLRDRNHWTLRNFLARPEGLEPPGLLVRR